MGKTQMWWVGESLRFVGWLAPKVGYTLLALLTPTIAVVTVYIAYQQWQTNQHRLKLDLYERRYKVYQAVREILGMMYTTVRDDRKLFELLSQTREAEFLFDDEISEYVEEVWRHATRLSDANKNLAELLNQNAPAQLRAPLADIESEEVQWALNETREIGRKFGRYLNLGNL